MREVQDQMQRLVRFKAEPKRIVSLVPSQTQLLHALGLEDQVVGITKFCIHPDSWYRNKPRIGGTKTVSIEKVRALQPDLILGNKEENERSDIAALEKAFPVWMSDICDLSDALDMIKRIGELTGTKDKATMLAGEIEKRFQEFDTWLADQKFGSRSVAYLIWNEPAFCAGKNTFIDAILQHCNFTNFVSSERYPELPVSTEKSPDLVFLSSEPYPFKEEHVRNFEQRYPNAKVVLVDGEMFSWYGSKLLEAPAYFRSLLEQLAAK